MKEGYIVMNQTNYGDGIYIFGVYRSEKAAEKQLRKVIRTQFGRCPRDLDDIYDLPGMDSGDSFCIKWFSENNGDVWPGPLPEDYEEF